MHIMKTKYFSFLYYIQENAPIQKWMFFVAQLRHSFELRGLCLMKWLSKMLQKLPCLLEYENIGSIFLFFPTIQKMITITWFFLFPKCRKFFLSISVSHFSKCKLLISEKTISKKNSFVLPTFLRIIKKLHDAICIYYLLFLYIAFKRIYRVCKINRYID